MHLRLVRMSSRFIVAVSLLAFAVSLAAQTAAWKPYDYPPDGFRATFPAAPEISKENVPTEVGNIELRLYTATLGDTALNISVCDYGAKAAAVDPDVILAGVEKGAIDNWKAKIISEKKILLGTNHGLEVVATNDSMRFSMRYYMVGGVLFQSMVVSPVAQDFPDTKRFLDSFELIPHPAS
jgi:hypothetical protein